MNHRGTEDAQSRTKSYSGDTTKREDSSLLSSEFSLCSLCTSLSLWFGCGLMTSEQAALLEQAREAGRNAYCPYSNFSVGAAVKTDRGVFVGCNVENASYGLAICAERVALFAAVAAGAKVFEMMAVSCLGSGEADSIASKMPCGACRQVMTEFLPQDSVVVVDGAGVWRVADLLPDAFRLVDTENTLEGEKP